MHCLHVHGCDALLVVALMISIPTRADATLDPLLEPLRFPRPRSLCKSLVDYIIYPLSLWQIKSADRKIMLVVAFSTSFITLLNYSTTTAMRSCSRRLNDGLMEDYCAMTMIIGVKVMYMGGLLHCNDMTGNVAWS